MPDIYLRQGATPPSDVILRDPTSAGGAVVLPAAAGVFSLSGVDAGFAFGGSLTLTADVGGFSLVGQDAGFVIGGPLVLGADTGVFTLLPGVAWPIVTGQLTRGHGRSSFVVPVVYRLHAAAGRFEITDGWALSRFGVLERIVLDAGGVIHSLRGTEAVGILREERRQAILKAEEELILLLALEEAA